MTRAGNVLLSSAGRRVALVDIFRSAIAAAGVPGHVVATDSSSLAPSLQVADVGLVVPPCNDASFVPTMLELCERERVSLLVPTIDTELAPYAAAREDFAAIGTTVAISSRETIAVTADKRRTHRFLTDVGVPTVRQAELREMHEFAASWPFPVVVKPSNGSASIGVAVVANEMELAVAAAYHDVVVQSVAEGVEITADVFTDAGGRCRGVVPRRRLCVRGGEVVKAQTTRLPAVIDLVERLVSLLPGTFGVLNVQLFWDAVTGRAAVIEINPRFGGGFPLSDHAGAPFARWLVELAAGREPDYDVKPWADGMLMLRYDAAVFVEQAVVETTTC